MTLEIAVVHAPNCPGVHRRIQIRELPLISRNLSIGVLELLEEHYPEILLRKFRIYQCQRRALEGQIPCCEPWILPLVGHRQNAHGIQVSPMMIADSLARL